MCPGCVYLIVYSVLPVKVLEEVPDLDIRISGTGFLVKWKS